MLKRWRVRRAVAEISAVDSRCALCETGTLTCDFAIEYREARTLRNAFGILLLQKMKTVRISLLFVLALCMAIVALPNPSATGRILDMHIKLRTWVHPFKNSQEWAAA